MSGQTRERLYNLLPAVYRIRDHHQGEPLRALMAVIEREFLALEEDIEGLYENWFIETCQEWAVSYIGDLLGARALHPGIPGIYSQRGFIANTLAYRRRKGTALVLEQMARDVTGWPAAVVEFGKLLGANQSLNHIRPEARVTPNLRDTDGLERLGGAFCRIAHGLDLRKIQTTGGKYNIPNVGLFLWRVQSYGVQRAPAGRLSTALYSFHPLGYQTELFNLPETETDIAHLAEEINVPAPIRPKALTLDLADFRRRYEADKGIPPESAYYGLNGSIAVYRDGASQPVHPRHIVPMDLTGWQPPPPPAAPAPSDPQLQEPALQEPVLPAQGEPAECRVGVDVRLGRLAFLDGIDPAGVEVGYGYGFSADIGGGPYNRHQTLARPSPVHWRPGLLQAEEGSALWLQEALGGWAEAKSPGGFIPIGNNGVFGGELTILLKQDSRLTIEALDEMQPSLCPAGGTRLRIELPPAGSATLTLNGLRMEEGIDIICHPDGGSRLVLKLIHCTLVPGGRPAVPGRAAPTPAASLIVDGVAELVDVTITNSITGPLYLPAAGGRLSVTDSIIDATPMRPEGAGAGAGGGYAIAADAGGRPGPATSLERCTVLGRLGVRELSSASEVIFSAPVYVERVQRGCVRYSYFPAGSRVPRSYRCQPGHALSKISGGPQQERERAQARLRPGFNGIRYGRADYCQLSSSCAVEIRTGAEDGSEMGAFSHLKQPQREANLGASLDEYLPFGLDSGIFFVT